MLFSPADHLINTKKGLITQHSLILVMNHIASISIYKPTSKLFYLKDNDIVGVAFSLSLITHISIIFDLQTKEKIIENQAQFIVDYRKLNNVTIQGNFPLPNLEQVIQMIGGHQCYTKLDLRRDYFQIHIREEEKHKITFINVHRLYELNIVAQGLKK
ncbi:unnamed protein product [Rotaria sp. Silwood2]|nr:unnamed protein product [Rotaria sp. Silwood2]